MHLRNISGTLLWWNWFWLLLWAASHYTSQWLLGCWCKQVLHTDSSTGGIALLFSSARMSLLLVQVSRFLTGRKFLTTRVLSRLLFFKSSTSILITLTSLMVLVEEGSSLTLESFLAPFRLIKIKISLKTVRLMKIVSNRIFVCLFIYGLSRCILRCWDTENLT